jgi:WD40 repeat protein
MLTLQWTKNLSALPLCKPPESCVDTYMVNAAAVSDDGSRVVGGTYYQHYENTTRVKVSGRFGIYCFDTAGGGTPLFAHEYDGDKGIYAVAISGDGTVAAGGGLLTKGSANPFKPKHGLLRAFDVATQQPLLDSSSFTDRVNSVALSRNGTVLVAVAESTLYIFHRSLTTPFATPPQSVDLAGYCETVAIHPDGTWAAAADQTGTVSVIPITDGVPGTPATWVAAEPENPTLPGSLKMPVKFHSVAIARATDAFTVGGGDVVYLLTRASMAAGTPGPVARFSSFDSEGHHSVRWVAIADDASFITAVVNDSDPAGNPKGRLVKLRPAGDILTMSWKRVLDHPPNSTSIDSSGTLITAAVGFPNHVQGAFYLFNQLGNKRGMHTTVDMNWPMQVSSNGKGIVAGSDDNSLLFFTP